MTHLDRSFPRESRKRNVTRLVVSCFCVSLIESKSKVIFLSNLCLDHREIGIRVWNGATISVSNIWLVSPDAPAVERLKAALAQKQEEVNVARSQLAQLERSRESMASEVVALVAQNEELTIKVARLAALETEFKEVWSNPLIVLRWLMNGID